MLYLTQATLRPRETTLDQLVLHQRTRGTRLSGTRLVAMSLGSDADPQSFTRWTPIFQQMETDDGQAGYDVSPVSGFALTGNGVPDDPEASTSGNL